MNSRIINLVGRRFGRLIVLEFAGTDKGRANWNCQCDCGRSVLALGSSLRRGFTTSCGCYQIEQTKKRNTRHGLKGSRIYSIWGGMLARCERTQHKSYAYYGGRGITVCAEWHVFDVFLKDMGFPPSDFHTLDRIDNAKGYCKTNCRWATPTEQARNRRPPHTCLAY
jgi:hypothetical protein